MNGPAGTFVIPDFPWGLLISREEAKKHDRKGSLEPKGGSPGKCLETNRSSLSLISSPFSINHEDRQG